MKLFNLLLRKMENWQAELDAAYLKGFKAGVTRGYANGAKDRAMTGYLTATHDLYDILEELQAGEGETIKLNEVLDKLTQARQMREATGVYIHSQNIQHGNGH